MVSRRASCEYDRLFSQSFSRAITTDLHAHTHQLIHKTHKTPRAHRTQIKVFTQLKAYSKIKLIAIKPPECGWCKNRITNLEQKWLPFIITEAKKGTKFGGGKDVVSLLDKGVNTENVEYVVKTFDEFKKEFPVSEEELKKPLKIVKDAESTETKSKKLKGLHKAANVGKKIL